MPFLIGHIDGNLWNVGINYMGREFYNQEITDVVWREITGVDFIDHNGLP